MIAALSPAAMADLSDFAVFGSEGVVAEYNVLVDGSVGSNANGDVVIFDNSRIQGSIASGGLVDLYSGTLVQGNVTSVDGAWLDSGVTVLGTVGPGEAPGVILAPVVVPGGLPDSGLGSPFSSLSLTSGSYYFSQLVTAPGATVDLDLSGGPITIYVGDGDAYLDDGTQFLLTGGSSGQVQFEVTGTGDFITGSDCALFGGIYAPGGSIVLGAGSRLVGTARGDYVVLEDGVAVVPAPGAAMLGATGLGLVGWVTRRRQSLSAERPPHQGGPASRPI
jgi:hypothetical protein